MHDVHLGPEGHVYSLRWQGAAHGHGAIMPGLAVRRIHARGCAACSGSGLGAHLGHGDRLRGRHLTHRTRRGGRSRERCPHRDLAAVAGLAVGWVRIRHCAGAGRWRLSIHGCRGDRGCRCGRCAGRGRSGGVRSFLLLGRTGGKGDHERESEEVDGFHAEVSPGSVESFGERYKIGVIDAGGTATVRLAWQCVISTWMPMLPVHNIDLLAAL